MNLNRLLTTVVSLLFIFKISAFETSIDPDHLSARTYKDSPQKSFALNDKNMQIKTPETSLVAAWVGHNISVSSENSIFFKAKALKNENILFNCKVQMLTYHTSPAEKCNGSARSKFFIFGNYAEKEWKEFYFPLKIQVTELLCSQCGKMLNHATFIFYFSTEEKGGIEFTPFNLKTAFHVRVQKKSDKHAPYLSNIFSPGYKPYEMKKLPDRSMLAGNFKDLSAKANIVRKQYAGFRQIVEMMNKNETPKAIVQAEKIASENIFSSVFLYLIYSRGYCGEKINYRKAAKYFNSFIGSYFGREPGYIFWIYEYQNIWKKYRLIPTFTGESAIINAWAADGRIMDEIVPLRGKYSLKNCYEESMRNIGGIGARAIFLIAREQHALADIVNDARKLGNAEAWAGKYAPFESRGLKPEREALAKESFNKPDESEFRNLKRASELGYIPAKLYLARALATKNFTADGLDLNTARKLLKEAIAECEKYSASGCKHAETDLKYARDLLAVIPEENTPVQELVKLYDQLQSDLSDGGNMSFLQFRLYILTEMISRKKSDHPDVLFMQALKLPGSQYRKKNELIRSAAEKGSLKAIKLCLESLFTRGNKDHWYFLYLAGKYKLHYNGSRKNYFNEAYMILQEMRYQMPMPEYMKAISILAPYHRFAKEVFNKLSKNLNFDISVSDKTTLSAVKKNDGGHHFIEIKAQPSPENRYIIIKNQSAEKIRGAIFFHSLSRQCSNLDLYGEFTDENGRVQKTYTGNSIPIKYLPTELKVFIAPRREALELKILYQIY